MDNPRIIYGIYGPFIDGLPFINMVIFHRLWDLLRKIYGKCLPNSAAEKKIGHCWTRPSPGRDQFPGDRG